jgi:hypothetical protein
MEKNMWWSLISLLVTCSSEGCNYDGGQPLFSASKILPGFTQNNSVQVDNQRSDNCKFRYRAIGETTSFGEVIQIDGQKINNLNSWVDKEQINSNSVNNFDFQLYFDREAGNHFQNKSLDINMDLDFECGEIQGLIINEIYPSPILPGQEWVELYNPGDQEINLANWKIDDAVNSYNPKVLGAVTIEPKSYWVFGVNSGFFNNGGDDVRLIDGQNNVVDIYTYTNIDSSQSWSRQENGMWCKSTPSYGDKNNLCDGEIAKSWIKQVYEWMGF